MHNRKTHSIGSSPTLIQRNLLNRALDLHQIDCLTLQIYHIAQNRLGLGKLVLVPRYEEKLLGRRHD